MVGNVTGNIIEEDYEVKANSTGVVTVTAKTNKHILHFQDMYGKILQEIMIIKQNNKQMEYMMIQIIK